MVVGEDRRVGVFLKGSKHESHETYDLSWGPAVEILEESRAKDQEEDIRLLYVAMTRAQQRLLLVGATSVDGKLDRCRMGRIIGALGLDHAPGEGESSTRARKTQPVNRKRTSQIASKAAVRRSERGQGIFCHQRFSSIRVYLQAL